MRMRMRVQVRRWVWRVVKWAVAPVVAVLLIRGVWGWIAARQVAEARRELQAAGVGVRAEDYAGPAIPDERNAVVPMLHAVDGLHLTKAERDLVTGADKPVGVVEADFSPAEDAEIDRILGSLGWMFGDLDAAMGRREARWPSAYLRDHFFLHFSELRLPAEIAELAARRAHERGDDGACLHHLRQELAVARVMDGWPDMLSHFVARDERANAAQALDHFLPGMQFDRRDDQEAQGLLAELLNDAAFRKAQLTAFGHEVVYAREELLKIYPQLDSEPLRPLADEDVARMLRRQLRYLAGAESPTYNPALLPAPSAPASGVLPVITVSADDYYPSEYDRIFMQQARSLADTRAAAILLAARMYREQHGRWPGSLGELRELMGAAPADPFARDGSSLRYRVDASGPTVWSVGEDGVDGGGILAAGASATKRRYDQVDLVYGAAWRAFSGK